MYALLIINRGAIPTYTTHRLDRCWSRVKDIKPRWNKYKLTCTSPNLIRRPNASSMLVLHSKHLTQHLTTINPGHATPMVDSCCYSGPASKQHGPTSYYHCYWGNTGKFYSTQPNSQKMLTQQTRDTNPMLFQSWSVLVLRRGTYHG